MALPHDSHSHDPTLLMDRAVRAGVFHLWNSVFEGSIALLHLLAPKLIYEGAGKVPPTKEQLLLGRFLGSMMLALGLVSYYARNNRGVAIGLAVYHTLACALNAMLGCGIDGNHANPARDYFHVLNHGALAAGFAWMVARTTRRSSVQGQGFGLVGPWFRVGPDALELEFVARNWDAVMHALEAYSKIAQELNHHPDVHVTDYRHVKISVRTHCNAPGTLTDKDLSLARALERVPLALADKWLQTVHWPEQLQHQ